MSTPGIDVPPTGATPDQRVLPAPWIALRNPLVERWIAMAPRERTGISAAAIVIGVFLLWSLAIQPAWRTARAAPAQIDQLEGQWQQMQRLATEAADLRNSPTVSAAQAGSALQSATARLGSRAQLMLQGDRATVTVKGLAGDELRNWLAEARSAARARATEVQLSRDPQGYSGTIVLSLGSGR